MPTGSPFHEGQPPRFLSSGSAAHLKVNARTRGEDGDSLVRRHPYVPVRCPVKRGRKGLARFHCAVGTWEDPRRAIVLGGVFIDANRVSYLRVRRCRIDHRQMPVGAERFARRMFDRYMFLLQHHGRSLGADHDHAAVRESLGVLPYVALRACLDFFPGPPRSCLSLNFHSDLVCVLPWEVI